MTGAVNGGATVTKRFGKGYPSPTNLILVQHLLYAPPPPLAFPFGEGGPLAVDEVF